jgi:alpha-L-fucosidase 2
MHPRLATTLLLLAPALCAPALCPAAPSAEPAHKLRYDAPAAAWEEALPIGNGRLGAMLYGDPLAETIQLNEETLWSGYPRDIRVPDGPATIARIRAAVEKGDYARAARLSTTGLQGPNSASYQPLAALHLALPAAGPVEDFSRDLDLATATATTRHKIAGVTHTRTAFVSHRDQVLVIRLAADRGKSISLDLTLDSQQPFSAEAGPNRLHLAGQVPGFLPGQSAGDETGKGIRFDARLLALPEGGTSTFAGATLSIRDADTLTLLVSAATSYNGFDKNPVTEGRDPSAAAAAHLAAAAPKTHAALLEAHLRDYQPLFARASLSLGPRPAAKDKLPADRRLAEFPGDDRDPGLVELLWQYGRYLTIASSRPGGLPANLQGIWNDRPNPPWSSNYTTNVNAQMNYWHAESTGLAECHEPLFDFIKNLSLNGAKTAQNFYGIQDGWVVHHNSDAWAHTAPVGAGRGNPRWACWPLAGAWYCTHLWEHYLHGGDTAFLRDTAWPLMRGSAAFFLAWLHQDPATGDYTTCPSTSPENNFFITGPDGKKTRGSITKGSAMDLEIIWELFTNCIAAANVLGIDAGFRETLETARARLAPLQVGARGNLLEWDRDFEETEPQHRHTSHLFALYPGRQIIPRENPAAAAAVRRALELRGNTIGIWASIWKAALWARLEDGNAAYAVLMRDISLVTAPTPGKTPTANTVTGGRHANLFDVQRQLDATYGFTAALTEMLVQSHGGEISLLPALPDKWPGGAITGIRCPGGFTVDLEWASGKPVKALIHSALGGNCRIRSRAPLRSLLAASQPRPFREAAGGNPNPFYRTDSAALRLVRAPGAGPLSGMDFPKTTLTDFDTQKNATYELRFEN